MSLTAGRCACAIYLVASLALGVAIPVCAQAPPVTYLKLSEPQRIDWAEQAWEGDQQPHTLSVVEWHRDGFRYWGWYGLNHGRGIGLARSNDLIHWTKFDGNPLWLNARWPSVLMGADPKHPEVLYFAITRDYDTPSSRIVLASSVDGIHLKEVKTLVPQAARLRNQNPNLFRDPRSDRFVLTFYRGNDEDSFDLVSKSAPDIQGLDAATDKLLMHTTDTVAAPTLLYVPTAGPERKGVYYLATEIYPRRYSKSDQGVWEVKVFYSDQPDGHFEPVTGNPIESGERACLFQHVFAGRFYGYQCHLDHDSQKWEMEVVTAPLPP